jgi:hypothetical protein
VKYNTFHYEQKKRYKKKKPYRVENFTYLPEQDQYVCQTALIIIRNMQKGDKRDEQQLLD